MYYNKYSVRVLTNGQPLKETNQYVFLKDKQPFEISLKNDNSKDAAAHVTIDGTLVGIYKVPAFKKVIIDSGMNDNGKFIFLKADTKEFKKAGLKNTEKTKGELGLVEVQFYEIKSNFEYDFQKIYDTIIIEKKCCGGCCDCCKPKPLPWQFPWTINPIWIGNHQPHVTYLGNTVSSSAKEDLRVYNESKGDNTLSANFMCSVSPGGVGLQGISEKEYEHVDLEADASFGKATVFYLRLVCKEGEDDVNRIRSKTAYVMAIPKPV